MQLKNCPLSESMNCVPWDQVLAITFNESLFNNCLCPRNNVQWITFQQLLMPTLSGKPYILEETPCHGLPSPSTRALTKKQVPCSFSRDSLSMHPTGQCTPSRGTESHVSSMRASSLTTLTLSSTRPHHPACTWKACNRICQTQWVSVWPTHSFKWLNPHFIAVSSIT